MTSPTLARRLGGQSFARLLQHISPLDGGVLRLGNTQGVRDKAH